MVLREGAPDLLAYHSYDTEENGMPHLAVSELGRTSQGRPEVRPVSAD